MVEVQDEVRLRMWWKLRMMLRLRVMLKVEADK